MRGKRENFFSREKKFSLSPRAPSLPFKKSEKLWQFWGVLNLPRYTFKYNTWGIVWQHTQNACLPRWMHPGGNVAFCSEQSKEVYFCTRPPRRSCKARDWPRGAAGQISFTTFETLTNFMSKYSTAEALFNLFFCSFKHKKLFKPYFFQKNIKKYSVVCLKNMRDNVPL